MKADYDWDVRYLVREIVLVLVMLLQGVLDTKTVGHCIFVTDLFLEIDMTGIGLVLDERQANHGKSRLVLSHVIEKMTICLALKGQIVDHKSGRAQIHETEWSSLEMGTKIAHHAKALFQPALEVLIMRKRLCQN